MFNIAVIFKQDNDTEMLKNFDMKLAERIATIDWIGAIPVHLLAASLRCSHIALFLYNVPLSLISDFLMKDTTATKQ